MVNWRREKNQINKIKDEKGDITTNTNEIQRIIRDYFQVPAISSIQVLLECIQVNWKI
jgi:hypothetical protein